MEWQLIVYQNRIEMISSIDTELEANERQFSFQSSPLSAKHSSIHFKRETLPPFALHPTSVHSTIWKQTQIYWCAKCDTIATVQHNGNAMLRFRGIPRLSVEQCDIWFTAILIVRSMHSQSVCRRCRRCPLQYVRCPRNVHGSHNCEWAVQPWKKCVCLYGRERHI